MRALVLTISDRASKGVYEDKSGPEIERILIANFPEIEVTREIIPDSKEIIQERFTLNLNKDLILTTGGTGIGPRDVTPEATDLFCDRHIPGIGEYLRRESCNQTTNAVLSRGSAGIKGKTIIINLPGSVKGVIFCTELLVPILPHAFKMISGEGH